MMTGDIDVWVRPPDVPINQPSRTPRTAPEEETTMTDKKHEPKHEPAKKKAEPAKKEHGEHEKKHESAKKHEPAKKSEMSHLEYTVNWLMRIVRYVHDGIATAKTP